MEWISILAFISASFYRFLGFQKLIQNIITRRHEWFIDPDSVVDGFRYYEELTHKFVNPLRVGAYVIAFVFLALTLIHMVLALHSNLLEQSTNTQREI